MNVRVGEHDCVGGKCMGGCVCVCVRAYMFVSALVLACG